MATSAEPWVALFCSLRSVGDVWSWCSTAFFFVITSTPVRSQAAAVATAHLQSTRLITHSLRNKETGNVNQPCLAITVGLHTSLRQTQLQLKAANLFWEAWCVCAYLLNCFESLALPVELVGVSLRRECAMRMFTAQMFGWQSSPSPTLCVLHSSHHPLLVSHSHPLRFFFSSSSLSLILTRNACHTFILLGCSHPSSSPHLSLQLHKRVVFPWCFYVTS